MQSAFIRHSDLLFLTMVNLHKKATKQTVQNAEIHNLLKFILKYLSENGILRTVIGVSMGILHPFLGRESV